jgi:hypothetical protein
VRFPRTRIRLLAVVSLLALVAVACSNSSGGGTGDGSSGPCTPAESPVITLAA